MSVRSYPDIRRTSPDGTWVLEALSPDNENELSGERGYEPKFAPQFRRGQRDFRYRLWCESGNRLSWERRQPGAEGSPKDAFVSDEGEVVVRTNYSGSWSCEDILFIGRDGTVGFGVTLNSVKGRFSVARPETDYPLWEDEHVRATTGGPMWSFGSFPTFVSGPRRLFSLRMAWGRRLVVDLERMVLLEDVDIEPLVPSIGNEERIRALETLRKMDGEVSEHTPLWQRMRVLGALVVVAAQRLLEAKPYLLEIASSPRAESWTDCRVLGIDWDVGHNKARSLAGLALRSMGHEPSRSIYQLQSRTSPPLTIAKREPDIANKATRTRVGSGPRTVLGTLGLPDFIEDVSRQTPAGYFQSHIWDYDHSDFTTRLTWTIPPNESVQEPFTVERVEIVEPPDWLPRALSFLYLEHCG